MTTSQHGNRTVTTTILSGSALSDAIDFRRATDMIIYMPAAWDAASIGFYASSEPDGTFVPLHDSADAVIEIDTPGVDTAYKAPNIAGVQFVQLWSQTAGADVNQTADRDLVVSILLRD